MGYGIIHLPKYSQPSNSWVNIDTGYDKFGSTVCELNPTYFLCNTILSLNHTFTVTSVWNLEKISNFRYYWFFIWICNIPFNSIKLKKKAFHFVEQARLSSRIKEISKLVLILILSFDFNLIIHQRDYVILDFVT